MRALSLLLLSLFVFPLCARAGGSLGKSAQAAEPVVILPPDQVMDNLSQPWVHPLTDLKPLLKKNKSYVFWLMILPDDPMDLRSPEQFRRFLKGNAPYKGSISHNLIAWSCRLPSGRRVEGATGMSGESNGQSREMLKAGFGLSIFYSVFTDGFLESTESAAQAMLDLGPKYGLAGLGFELSGEACENMLGFLNKFVYHPRIPYSRFGLTVDPEKMEGGGCVNFAMALLNHAGLFRDVIPHFYRHLKAPPHLMGGNLEPPPYAEPPRLSWLRGEPREISAFGLLETPWVTRGEGVPLKLMDPELMLYSMKAVKEVYLSQFAEDVAAPERKWLNRSSLGKRTVRSQSLETDYDDPGRFQLDFFPINDTFDGQTAKVGQLAADYARKERAKGKVIRRGLILKQPVLLIER